MKDVIFLVLGINAIDFWIDGGCRRKDFCEFTFENIFREFRVS
jgi:hypothetical protein